MKIGIVFAGQGAQYSGMGKDLYDSYPEAKEIFDMAGDQVKEWCFNGDEETLKQTHVTQPTIYTTTMAAYKALMAELERKALPISWRSMRWPGSVWESIRHLRPQAL